MSLKRYLSEAELAANQPVTGDEFDISINELTNIETTVVEHAEDSIVIDLDENAIAMLEDCGCTFSDDQTVEAVDTDVENSEHLANEGDVVKINHPSEHNGKLGQIVELSPSGKFAYVEFKDGSIASFDLSNVAKVDREEADAYFDQSEDQVDELAPIKALAGLGSKLAGSGPSKAAGRVVKNAANALDKKLFGPKPHEGDYEESRVNEAGWDKSPMGPYDRGAADAYYGRPMDPHKWVDKIGGVEGERMRVKLTDPNEIAAYEAGYKEAEFGDKDYGKFPDYSDDVDETSDLRRLAGLPMAENKAPKKWCVVHKETNKVLHTCDDEATAKDHLEGLGDDKGDYKVVQRAGKPKDWSMKESIVSEAEYQGRQVQLGKPSAGDVKKYKVYVRDPKSGNIKKVNFGDPNMEIKRDNPERRKNFRARHNCSQKKDRTKAGYWSCRMWSKKPVSKIVK